MKKQLSDLLYYVQGLYNDNQISTKTARDLECKIVDVLSKAEQNQLANFVSVYAKDKKIRVLGMEESSAEHDLIKDGWQHTTTTDACKWIEHLHNECKNWNVEINDLHRNINQLTKKQ